MPRDSQHNGQTKQRRPGHAATFLRTAALVSPPPEQDRLKNGSPLACAPLFLSLSSLIFPPFPVYFPPPEKRPLLHVRSPPTSFLPFGFCPSSLKNTSLLYVPSFPLVSTGLFTASQGSSSSAYPTWRSTTSRSTTCYVRRRRWPTCASWRARS